MEEFEVTPLTKFGIYIIIDHVIILQSWCK